LLAGNKGDERKIKIVVLWLLCCLENSHRQSEKFVKTSWMCYNDEGRIKFSKTPPTNNYKHFNPISPSGYSTFLVRMIYGTGQY
jgi:hypothetical protein